MNNSEYEGIYELREYIRKALQNAGLDVHTCEMNSIFFEHKGKEYGFAIRPQRIHNLVNYMWTKECISTGV